MSLVPTGRVPFRCAATLLAVAVLATVASATDVVVRRGGADVEGHVVSVDESHVVVNTDRGRVRIPRSQVSSITFGGAVRPAPPLKVEIRNERADDALDVLLDDEPIIERARAEGSWIDITDRLKTGNHALRLRIHNDRGGWGYRVGVRINGVVTRVECGEPPVRPCRCCGKNGTEVGVIDDLPITWIWVDRDLGTAELQR